MIFLPDLEARKTLTSEQRSWLALRPYVWCGPDFACTHADFSAPSDWLYILKPKDAWRSLWARNEEVLFVGHTHIPFIMKQPADKVKLSHSFDEEEANLLTTQVTKVLLACFTPLLSFWLRSHAYCLSTALRDFA